MWSIQGRVSRSYYWLIMGPALFILGVSALLVPLPYAFIFTIFGAPSITSFLSIVLGIFFIPLGILYIIATIKRYHDRDKSGWWSLVSFIPYIGVIWVLIECGCLKGTDGPNRFGPDPLEPAQA